MTIQLKEIFLNFQSTTEDQITYQASNTSQDIKNQKSDKDKSTSTTFHPRSSTSLGKPAHANFDNHEITEINFEDTKATRKKMRIVVSKFLETQKSLGYNSKYLDTIERNLIISKKFDLLILMSGNLYYQGKHVSSYKLSENEKSITLTLFDDTKIQLDSSLLKQDSSVETNVPDRLLWSHDIFLNNQQESPSQLLYNPFQQGLAIYFAKQDSSIQIASPVSITKSVSGLLELPENYLDRILFLKRPSNKETEIPPGVLAEIDLEEEGNEVFVTEKYSYFHQIAYTFHVEGVTIEIRIPFSNKLYQKGRHRFTEQDILRVLHTSLQLIPKSFLPKHMIFTLMPCTLKDNTLAFVHDINHVVFGNVKSAKKTDWFKEILLSTLQHEMAHIFHNDNRNISTLIYRCMMLDGWTMEYGEQSIIEYFAVLAEYFFEFPEKRHLFPHGYRLLYTLIKMRENNIHWNDEIAHNELIRLQTGQSLSIKDTNTDEEIKNENSSIDFLSEKIFENQHSPKIFAPQFTFVSQRERKKTNSTRLFQNKTHFSTRPIRNFNVTATPLFHTQHLSKFLHV